MKKLMVSMLCLIPCAVMAAAMTGFSEVEADAQRALENEFDSHLSGEEQKQWMQRLSARPHHLGSAYDRDNAEYIAALFESWGFDTELETYEVLFPTPKTRLLEMIEPTAFTASLAEPAIPEDATSAQQDEQLPVYNAYSIDGDVTAEVVYVNFGVPKDYEELERRGIDVRGKIVLARYYGSWRGIKPKVAAEKGAIGTIIYSDPHEDGFFQGDVYPHGAFRNETGAQRGSVMDMPLYPGDPLTPGIGATKRAKRLDIDEAQTLTKIPVIPISYQDALPILGALQGPVAPEAWRGSLPVTYHLGPGPARVHLKLAFNWDRVTLYNVIAKMRGDTYPDEWVIRGNHHDAWVNGARDPISGMVVVMAEAKALGALVKAGMRPKRTVVYAAWDGEEQGLIGSTEWVEHHRRELDRKAVAYINTDSNGRGFLRAGGSHTLEKMMNQVARDVTDPQTGVSVFKRLKAAGQILGDSETQKEMISREDFRLYPLGSGSDYSPFLQHLGIASLNLGYSGESSGGSYHSIYDSFDHYRRFSDPEFEYGVALAQTAGRATLRLANAELLPFEFTGFADNVSTYLEDLIKLAEKMREDTKKLNRMLKEEVFKLALDPRKADRGPGGKEAVPHIAFADLKNALDRVHDSADHFKEAMAGVDVGGLSKRQKKKINSLLYQSERRLLREEGLPRRPWYKHHIYAPGFYTGYGVKTLPGVREAVEERQWQEADAKIGDTAEVLRNFADQIDGIVSLLVE